MGPTAEEAKWSYANYDLFLGHNVVVIALLWAGGLALAQTTRAFVKHYRKLNAVVKAFSSVLVADWAMIIIFVPQSISALVVGRVADGPWCKLLGWGALIQLTALLFSVVVVSFATWRLVVANPLSDVHLLLAIIGSWVAAVIVGSAFWGDGIVGPYKNLYCCVRTDSYKQWAVALMLIFVFGSGLWAGVFYRMSLLRLRAMEEDVIIRTRATTRASSIVLHRGLMLVLMLFLWWSLVIVVGLMRANGGDDPVALDVLAAVLVKCMPLFDAVFIGRMVDRVAAREVGPPPVNKGVKGLPATLTRKGTKPKGGEQEVKAVADMDVEAGNTSSPIPLADRPSEQLSQLSPLSPVSSPGRGPGPEHQQETQTPLMPSSPLHRGPSVRWQSRGADVGFSVATVERQADR